jgi:glycosyltransferase involved in cell wall biosynthesis
VPSLPSASIVIPTHARADYLDVTLASVMPQAARAGAEVLVVNDGSDPATAAVAQRHRAELIVLEHAPGANAARNQGIASARSDVLVFIDDDIQALPGWLERLLAGVRSAPEYEVFGGPIAARLEGGGPRACGREAPPITTLDLGPHDRDAPLVWSANMAVRRAAFDRVGTFDETLRGHGDEEEWERRYLAAGGRIRYLGGAALEHRRSPADATLRALSRAAYHQGRARRRTDVRKRAAPPLRRELRILAGCAWHTARRRCANGIVLAAECAGRIREALTERSEQA